MVAGEAFSRFSGVHLKKKSYIYAGIYFGLFFDVSRWYVRTYDKSGPGPYRIIPIWELTYMFFLHAHQSHLADTTKCNRLATTVDLILAIAHQAAFVFDPIAYRNRNRNYRHTNWRNILDSVLARFCMNRKN